MALKDWKKWDSNRWHNQKLDKTIILQEGTNIMFIQDWKRGKRSQTPPAPSRKSLVEFAKKYMRIH
jgi:hypothetical protein